MNMDDRGLWPRKSYIRIVLSHSSRDMKVELILPIARLRGKLNGHSPFYFKTVNGKTYVQRCPDRSTKAPTPAQTAAKQRFAAITQIVARMKAEGSKKSRKQLWKIATKAYDAENQ